jgi:hypothetical protein
VHAQPATEIFVFVSQPQGKLGDALSIRWAQVQIAVGARFTKRVQYFAGEAADHIVANQSDEIVIWLSIDVSRYDVPSGSII